jgi:hypothetical protein
VFVNARGGGVVAELPLTSGFTAGRGFLVGSIESTDETGTREAPPVDWRGLTFVLLRAVAVGFEPTVKLPPHTLSRSAPGLYGQFTMIQSCSRRFITAGQIGVSSGPRL